uniref:Uncharacterized protein n=1 Tax=Rhizophora mucronata TaxID=61149 RepID=A0A2P2JNK0_RHIMU
MLLTVSTRQLPQAIWRYCRVLVCLWVFFVSKGYLDEWRLAGSLGSNLSVRNATTCWLHNCKFFYCH